MKKKFETYHFGARWVKCNLRDRKKRVNDDKNQANLKKKTKQLLRNSVGEYQ